MVDSSKAPYVYDSRTKVLRINGKSFKLADKITADAMIEYGGRLAVLLGTAGAIERAIGGFARGEWADYRNAGEKIKALNAEAKLAKEQLAALSAEFDGFFEPAGVREQFGDDSAAYTHFVKSLVRGVAEVGALEAVAATPQATEPAPAAPPAAPVEAPLAG